MALRNEQTTLSRCHKETLGSGISVELSPGEYTSLTPPFHIIPAVTKFFTELLMSFLPVDVNAAFCTVQAIGCVIGM